MRKIKKKIILILIIIFILIVGYRIKREIFLYNLNKSGAVVIYKDINGNTAVLNYNKNSLDWVKIIRETKGYSINQIKGSKVLASSLREIIEYDYKTNVKKVIYNERDDDYCIVKSIYLDKERVIVEENSIIKYKGRIIEYNKERNEKIIIDNNITTERYITHNKNGDIIYEHFDYKKHEELGIIVIETELRIYSKDKNIYRLKEENVMDIKNNRKTFKVSKEDFEPNDFKTDDGMYSFKWELNISGILERKYSYILKAVNEKTDESITLYETERKHIDNNESLDDFKMDISKEYLFVF